LGLKGTEMSRDSSIKWISTIWTGIRFPNRARIFLFAVAFRSDLESNQPVLNGCRGYISGKKRPECETNYSLLSSVEVKNGWNFTSIPPHVFVARCLNTGTLKKVDRRVWSG
jgi:hypothetical protein